MKESAQQQIFDEWLEKNRSLFFKVVRAYAFIPQDQEDLFHEVATQVGHTIPKFRGQAQGCDLNWMCLSSM